MEELQKRIDFNKVVKNKFIEYYEESKEFINFKSQLIFSLVQSIKKDNTQFFSKCKFFIFIKYINFNSYSSQFF